MNFNISKIGKIVGQLVLAAPAIISAIKPVIRIVKGRKPSTSVGGMPPAQPPLSPG